MHYNAWRLVSLWLPAHISSCWAQITYILHYYRYHSTGLQHSFPTDNAMPTPPHPDGVILVLPETKGSANFNQNSLSPRGCVSKADG